jgi:hypothetical protein
MSKVQGDRFRLPEELGGQSSQTNFVKVGASMSKQQKRKRSPEYGTLGGPLPAAFSEP